jgi:hypothetical protein
VTETAQRKEQFNHWELGGGWLDLILDLSSADAYFKSILII